MSKCYYNENKDCFYDPPVCLGCDYNLKNTIKKLAEANPNYHMHEMFCNTMRKAGLSEEEINALYEVGWYI